MGLNELNKIIQAFLPDESLSAYSKLALGHINQTFVVHGRFSSYVLQNINTQIFSDPKYLNKLKVRLSTEMNELVEYPITYLYPISEEYNSWACSNFLVESRAYEFCVSTKLAQGLGRKLGQFHNYSKSLNPSDFKEIIPDFHNMTKRLDQLKEARNKASEKRLELSEPLFEIIERYQKEILSLTMRNQIQKRVVHNDAKCSNFLFDRQDNCLCIIDFDTVMPGYLAYDFGDAIRSISCSKNEDAIYEGLPQLQLGYIEGFIQAYALACKSFISKEEVSSLLNGVYHMTAIMAIRFLTDFLNNDKYFKVSYPEQNFNRAQHQFKLLESQIRCDLELQAIVNQSFGL
ncbi:aminoglycoside phosphotransferase family protein [Flavobacteriaceae bacterium]|nr:aminoglycoside phosphotransferase family protein [Flavobacteriaceae bacterium]